MSNVCLDNYTPLCFFREKVIIAQKRQNLKLSEDVEYYLVNLLCEFINPKSNSFQENCLALLLKQAIELSNPQEQAIVFRRLADSALYLSGYFQEYFTQKSFDIAYYVSMGSNAYGQLSQVVKNTPQKPMAPIFSKMKVHFSEAVDILIDVSEQTHITGANRSQLSLYEAWMDTGSPKLQKQLISQGIYPITTGKKRLQ